MPESEPTTAAWVTDLSPEPTAGSTAGPVPGAVTYLSVRIEPAWAALLAPRETGAATSEPRGEALGAAAERARAARDELQAADAALDALMARAREEGASWRSIARATGVPHREAAVRWGDPGDGPAL